MSFHLPHHFPNRHPIDRDALVLWAWLALSAACIVVTVIVAYGLTACMAATP